MEWPSKLSGYQTYGTAASWGPSITTGANNIKSSPWTEMVSSTTISGLVGFRLTGNGAYSYLADFAIGSVGYESILLENLQIDHSAATTYSRNEFMMTPLFVPSGVRLSCRGQSTYTSTSICYPIIRLNPINFLSGISPCSVCKTYGAVTGTSRGTSIDPGAVGSTKGNWTQLTASTDYSFSSFSICIGNQMNAARTTANWWVDIGITSSPSNAIISPDILLGARAETDFMIPKFIGPIMAPIPKGTEIHVRASCDITDATDRLFDIILYCFA